VGNEEISGGGADCFLLKKNWGDVLTSPDGSLNVGGTSLLEVKKQKERRIRGLHLRCGQRRRRG